MINIQAISETCFITEILAASSFVSAAFAREAVFAIPDFADGFSSDRFEILLDDVSFAATVRRLRRYLW